MRRLGQASGRAFTEAMRQDFTREKDLYSFLEYQFKVNGCDTNAFVPVVAGGEVNFPTFKVNLILTVLERLGYSLHSK